MFTFGTMAMADYIEPTSTAPAGNTGAPVLVGVGTVNIAHKFGTWEGADPNIKTKDYIKSVLNNGSYAGSDGVNGVKGGFGEKLVVNGATRFLTSDLLTQVIALSGNSFDQFINTIKYSDKGVEKTAKALQGIIAGRMLGGISITNDINLAGNTNANPTYSLDFLATNVDTSSYKPTTNIGLGDSCNLYPADIGVTVGDGGGCPAGSFISYYKKPTFSGTITSTNNTNSQVVATCTKFNPSANPTNTGRCVSNTFASLSTVYEYSCNDISSPQNGQKTWGLSYNWCNSYSSAGPGVTATGECKFDVTVNKKNGKNPYAQHTLSNQNPSGPSGFTAMTSSGDTYTYSKQGTCASYTFQVRDDYGQYSNLVP